jgi:hypothetical protein
MLPGLLNELSLVLHLTRQSGVAGHDEGIIGQIDFLPYILRGQVPRRLYDLASS